MFWYHVWYNDSEAIGVGISKQEAKQSAAKALIDKFTGVSDLVTKISTKINGDIGNLNTSIESNIFGNPIGWVKEFCTARRWPQPIYKIESKLVLRKETQFTIACVVSKYREVGHGTSQKNAKRMAANKMWDKIQKSALVNSKANEDMDGEYNTEAISDNTETINYKQILQQISTMHQFEIEYENIKEKTAEGSFQCLIHLSNLPSAVVCQGTGATAVDAQANVAHTTLQYLNLIFRNA